MRGYIGGDISYGMIDNPGVSTIEDHYARMRAYPRGFGMTLNNAIELMGSIVAVNTSENTSLFNGGIDLSERYKWIGGVLAPNGKIYGIPNNSSSVLCIDPSNNTASTFGNLSGTYKWYGGVLAPNGKIYGIPDDSTSVLCIDPSNNTVSTFGSLSGLSKWSGGVLAPNGKIYGIPWDSSTVLCIDGVGSTSSKVQAIIHPFFNKF